MNPEPQSQDYLKSIDSSLNAIKNIMLWWLVLSVAGAIGLLALKKISEKTPCAPLNLQHT